VALTRELLRRLWSSFGLPDDRGAPATSSALTKELRGDGGAIGICVVAHVRGGACVSACAFRAAAHHHTDPDASGAPPRPCMVPHELCPH
jgi:hypothetical protein